MANFYLGDFQCGFRQGRSILNHLISVEMYLCVMLLSKKEYVMSNRYNLELRYRLEDLDKLGLRGRCPSLFQTFYLIGILESGQEVLM